MSAKEIDEDGAPEHQEDLVRRASRRFAIIIVISILLAFALIVGGLYLIYTGRLRRNVAAQNPSAAAQAANAGRKRQPLKSLHQTART